MDRVIPYGNNIGGLLAPLPHQVDTKLGPREPSGPLGWAPSLHQAQVAALAVGGAIPDVAQIYCYGAPRIELALAFGS